MLLLRFTFLYTLFVSTVRGADPTKTFSDAAHVANNVGDLVHSARSYRTSRDPLHYVPFQITPECNQHFPAVHKLRHKLFSAVYFQLTRSL